MVDTINNTETTKKRIIQEFKRNHFLRIKLHTKGDKFDSTKKSTRAFFDRQKDLQLLLNESKQSYYKTLEDAFKKDKAAYLAIQDIANMMIEILIIANDFMYPPIGDAPNLYQLEQDKICKELDALSNPFEYTKLDLAKWLSKEKWDLATAASILAGHEPGDWDNDIKYRLMLEFSDSPAAKIYQKATQERIKHIICPLGSKLKFKNHNKEKWIKWSVNHGITQFPSQLFSIINDDQKQKLTQKSVNPFYTETAWHTSLYEAYDDYLKIKGSHPTAKPLKEFIQERKLKDQNCYEAIVSFGKGKKDFIIQHYDTNKSLCYSTFENAVRLLRKANNAPKQI